MNIYRIGAAPLVLSVALAGLAAGQTASKSKHPWTSFGPGSWAKVKSTNVNEATKMATVVETKITLLEKTAAKIVLETEVTVMGNTTKTKADFPANADPDAIPEGVTVLKRGTETITIAGKTLNCKTLETAMDAGGTKIHSKTWTSDQVPGSLVKSVNTMKGNQTTVELVEFKAL